MDISHILQTDNLSFNDAPELVWIRVQDAAKLLWNENPKLHNIGDLVKSIEKYGYQEIVKFDKNLINVSGTTGAVVAGNGRIESLAEMEKQKRQLPRGLALLKETGEWVMPVVVGVDQENINKAKAFAIDSNNLGLSGGDFTAIDMSRMWNTSQYLALLQGLSAENEPPVSVDQDTIGRLASVLGEQEESKDAEPQIDKAAELQEKWGVKTGDLFAIGNHKLLCGDSTKREDVERVMGGEKAKLIWTDPPYGVNYGDKLDASNPISHRVRCIENDDLPPEKLEEFLRICLHNISENSMPGCAIYVACPPGTLLPALIASFAGSGFEFRWGLVWLKDQIVLSRADYHFKHENILYGWKTGASHYFTEDRTQSSVFEYPRPKISDEHPTMKPVALIQHMLRNSSRLGEIVADIFGGSGSTMLACQNEKRNCRMIEKEPKYCAVILQRMTDAFPGIIIEKIE